MRHAANAAVGNVTKRLTPLAIPPPPRRHVRPYIGLNEPPHSWVIIEPQFTNSRSVEVLVATGETVLVVDANDAIDMVRERCTQIDTLHCGHAADRTHWRAGLFAGRES